MRQVVENHEINFYGLKLGTSVRYAVHYLKFWVLPLFGIRYLGVRKKVRPCSQSKNAPHIVTVSWAVADLLTIDFVLILSKYLTRTTVGFNEPNLGTFNKFWIWPLAKNTFCTRFQKVNTVGQTRWDSSQQIFEIKNSKTLNL